MPTAQQNLCCKDVAEVVAKEQDGCITGNEDFATLCLNTAVLRVAYVYVRNDMADDTEVLGDVDRSHSYTNAYLFPVISLIATIPGDTATQHTGNLPTGFGDYLAKKTGWSCHRVSSAASGQSSPRLATEDFCTLLCNDGPLLVMHTVYVMSRTYSVVRQP